MKSGIWLLFIALLMPYSLLGQEAGSIVLMLAGIIFLLVRRDSIRVDRYYMLILLASTAAGIVSLFFAQDLMKSLGGLTVYINMALFYIIFSSIKQYNQKIINTAVYVISSACLVFIVYQGAILKARIDGNFGYANTYALLLIAGLYFNEIKEDVKLTSLIRLILMLGIIYSGSRNSYVYLAVFLVINIYNNIKRVTGFLVLFDFFMALLIYIFLQISGVPGLLLLPIILYIYYIMSSKASVKLKNCLSIVLCVVGIVCLFTVKNSFTDRLAEFSLNTGELQERLVFFEDSAKHILDNPQGSGINSFEYRQYKDQSAFYDVKYIHNSILQSGYDMGILGLILFLGCAIYGFILVLKGKDKNKLLYLSLYISIYLHSLLDFDFSYASIVLMVVMSAAFAGENAKLKAIEVKHNIFIKGALLAFSIYLSLDCLFVGLGDEFLKGGDFRAARALYSIDEAVTFKNPGIYQRIAQTYNDEYSSKNGENLLDQCIYNLKMAQVLNPDDPRIVGNLAFTYERMGNSKETISRYNSFLDLEGFYYKVYQLYYNYLEKQYEATKDNEYKAEEEKLKARYYESYKLLNPKADYMKDQLPSSFEEMLSIK